MKNIDSTKILDTIRNINPKEILNTNQIIGNIQIADPIKVIDITEKGFDFGLWISVLIAIISTSVLIWNEIKKSKVYGKVISKTYSQVATYSFRTKANEEKTINGQQYILGITVFRVVKRSRLLFL